MGTETHESTKTSASSYSSLVLPPDEDGRLAALRRYNVLDTPPDGAFDRVAELAARYCNTPVATVTFVDANRIWFKATHGLDVCEVPRDNGLCSSAILGDGPYVVRNAATDPRSLDNPLVRGEFGLRFYAAAPIVTSDGYRLGTVNVVDVAPPRGQRRGGRHPDAAGTDRRRRAGAAGRRDPGGRDRARAHRDGPA